MAQAKTVRTATLEIGYLDSGPATSVPAVLLHGFPYAPDSFSDVAAHLNAAGVRTIVPFLRGYGPTRFLSADTMRSGEQAAIGQDLRELLDALDVKRAVLAGYDWGARAACIVAALWPERTHGLLTCGGYQIQDIARAARPDMPEQELRYWYQYYFCTERGRNGLEKNRAEIGRLLWRMWSPGWRFDAATYARTAAAFDNPDYVDVVIHSYRHRNRHADGDPCYAALEARLAKLPTIGVPTIVIHGEDDDVNPPVKSERQERFFTGPFERRIWANVGHNPPQEAPRAFADAVLELWRGT